MTNLLDCFDCPSISSPILIRRDDSAEKSLVSGCKSTANLPPTPLRHRHRLGRIFPQRALPRVTSHLPSHARSAASTASTHRVRNLQSTGRAPSDPVHSIFPWPMRKRAPALPTLGETQRGCGEQFANADSLAASERRGGQ